MSNLRYSFLEMKIFAEMTNRVIDVVEVSLESVAGEN